MEMKKSWSDITNCIHHPDAELEGFSSLSVPVYRASTIVFDTVDDFYNRSSRNPDGYSYGLNGTPTVRVLEQAITRLHRGKRTIVTSSGQASIVAIALSILGQGDHFLIPDNVYPPVKQFCRDVLAKYGVQVSVYDPTSITRLESLMRPGVTKLVWVESPGSTTMEVCDIPAIVRIAHQCGALVGCDNTWATPLFCKPLELGADIVVEALTKYISGHSDLLLGSITFSDYEQYKSVRHYMSVSGQGVSPDDCFLALRGLETMALRVNRCGEAARELCRRLQVLIEAERILHPANQSCPGHTLWARDYAGSTGLFSVIVNPSLSAVLAPRIENVSCFSIGASWGGTKSLLAPVNVKDDRIYRDKDNEIIRISIGIEDVEDIWADLEKLFSPA